MINTDKRVSFFFFLSRQWNDKINYFEYLHVRTEANGKEYKRRHTD